MGFTGLCIFFNQVGISCSVFSDEDKLRTRSLKKSMSNSRKVILINRDILNRY